MSKIVVDKGIIAILRDGTIINFPEGNDEDYQTWLKTSEADAIWMLLSDKDGVLSHEVNRAEAYDLLQDMIDDDDVSDALCDVILQPMRDRIAELFRNPKPAGWAAELMLKWQEEYIAEIEDDKRKNAKQAKLDVNL